MSGDRVQDTYDPRFDGIYQRGGSTAAASPAPPPPPLPYAPETPPIPSAPAVIREVGDGAVPPPQAGARNPYDVWLWIVAGVSLALGVYFLWAPALHEQAYMESVISVGPASTSYQGPPWFSYTVAAGPPLIFLGGAAAVGQLALLSLRHTRQTS
ncbi:hypothetical protein FDK12_07235 [Arthrobacter sp. NamB2]|uniref:hypothetical protein n=1 Tax=Arthrobacter sp. NamB2 TaxID=2576035 RepID=UPI0010CA1918|nr:hypothetical protein [Arthrobacter sp. NamB2]TKV28452.1 hypothetical protein FDK12_07235 [Arthrobacter sp. NamB2]